MNEVMGIDECFKEWMIVIGNIVGNMDGVGGWLIDGREMMKKWGLL